MRTLNAKRFGILALLAAVTAGGSGCASMNNTERGALGGGVVGGALGTAVGAATGRPLAGAAIGAAAGTAGGALIGNDIDKQENHRKDIAAAVADAQAQAQAAAQRMTIGDVIEMTKAGQNETIIINQIRKSRSTFDLSANEVNALKANGVSDRVIAEMQVAQGPPPAPARVVVREQPRTVIYESAPVYVAPAPYYYAPRPYYGGSFVYIRR